MSFQELLAALIAECELFKICSLFQYKLNNVIIELFLCFVHFHFQTTEIMQQRISPFLIDNPVNICPILNQQLSNQKTYFFILKTSWFLHQPKQSYSQWDLIQHIRLVHFSIGQ